MNKIINRSLLTGDKFMSELHLKQSGFTYIVLDHLLKMVIEFQDLEKFKTFI